MHWMNDRRTNSFRRIRCSALLLTLLVPSGSGGCNPLPEGPPTFPVEGSLTIDGKPAEGAQVILHPADGRNFDQRGARPTGRVASDGTFQVTTYHAGDGAPAGRYVVTIFWAVDPDSLEPSPDRLKGRFLDPARSTLNAEIKAAATKLPNWNLTTR